MEDKVMVRILIISIILICISPIVLISQNDNNLFRVERFVTATGIEEREPVGLASIFSADIERVYCFLEARDIKRDTEVTFVWYAGDTKVSEVTLGLGEGTRWRTFTYKTIGNAVGEWRIELLDETGNLIDEVKFTTE